MTSPAAAPPNELLTPAEALAHFRYRDRHSLAGLVARGLLGRINTGGQGKGARWLYWRTAPEPSEFDANLAKLKREHGF